MNRFPSVAILAQSQQNDGETSNLIVHVTGQPPRPDHLQERHGPLHLMLPDRLGHGLKHPRGIR